MSLLSLASNELNRVAPFRSMEPGAPIDGDDDQSNNALKALIKYIPTETITLYVASISAAPALHSAVPVMDTTKIYWFFVILTPAILFLVYAGKRKAKTLPAFPQLREWPWWKLIAATIAFSVWALAVPNNPFIHGDGGAVLAGLAAVFISTILSLFDRIFEPTR